MGGGAELMCYNKGCGQKFREETNVEDVCQFHPGAPIFHDAYKSWSCCSKKSTDFTEFLNFPGCTKGKHSNVKPVVPEKKKEKPLEIGEVYKEVAPNTSGPIQKKLERPSDDLEKQQLKVIVGSSLKSAIQRYKAKVEEEKGKQASGEGCDNIQVGASCKHNTCECKYLGADNNYPDCVYHPGAPVFHEGYKFWTCCQKRTSDFDVFLKQGGCTKGKHAWMKPSEVAEKKSTCRYDWHQTAKNVIVSIYAKTCDPEKCIVMANETGLEIRLAFNGGVNTFELQVILHGIIDPGVSSVEFLGTKAEIKLHKKESCSWPTLEYKEPVKP